MGKIAVDTEGKELVDEAMVPVFLMAREHGLHPTDPDEGDPATHTPARLVFPTPEEALEFLTCTHHHTNFTLDDQIMLSIAHPPEGADHPPAKVYWLPNLTNVITEAWRMSYR